MKNVPLHYKRFAKVFGKEMQSELPEHGSHDTDNYFYKTDF